MMKTEEIKPRTTNLQMHYPCLGFLWFQTKLNQQRPQPRQGGLGLLTGLAHHQRVVGEANEHSVLAHIPCSVNPMQIDVTKQRTDDSSNAVGNFCFEVSLSYRRVELPRRVSATV